MLRQTYRSWRSNKTVSFVRCCVWPMRGAEQGFQIVEKFEFAIDAKAPHNCMLNIMRFECRFWQKHSRKKGSIHVIWGSVE